MPTADQKLEVSQQTIAKLSELRVRTKYVDMPGTIYNGMKRWRKMPSRNPGYACSIVFTSYRGRPNGNWNCDGQAG